MKIEYGSPNFLYSNRVNMRSVISVQVLKSQLKFERSYVTNGHRRFVLAPSYEENVRTISGILQQTLQRVFDDGSFLSFIS